MKIIVDENMPYARELFGRTGKVIAVPGRPLPVALLREADALMVRSVTRVDEALLKESAVKFVGTATAGKDHVDENALRQRGIGFSSAPGCNAIAVVEYVFSALLMLAERDGFALRDRTVGIVGVGHVGSRLQKRLQAFGVRVLLCDPPRAARGDNETFYPLETLVAEADVLTLHTPLYREGPDKTWHLIDRAVLEALRAKTVLINACRGEVVDNAALYDVMRARQDLSVVLDVWENEPHLSQSLLAQVDIATPHIAGYTLEGKARGTTQVFEAWCAFLGQPQSLTLSSLLPKAQIDTITLHGEPDQAMLKRLIHLVYDVRRDDARLRHLALVAGGFDYLRKNYPERRECSSLRVRCDNAAIAERLSALGFNATD